MSAKVYPAEERLVGSRKCLRNHCQVCGKCCGNRVRIPLILHCYYYYYYYYYYYLINKATIQDNSHNIKLPKFASYSRKHIHMK